MQWTRRMWFTWSHYLFIKKIIELGLLVSGMSTVWEDTNGCAKGSMCALDIYLLGVLSSVYGIIMDCAINAPVHGRNVVDGVNYTDKKHFKEQMELCNKLLSKDTSKIGMLPSASKDVSVKFSEQCLHIINNNA